MSVSKIEEGKTYWVQGNDGRCWRLTAVQMLHAGHPDECSRDELCLIRTGPFPYLGVGCGAIGILPSGEASYQGHRIFVNREEVEKLLRQSKDLREQAKLIESM